jgi:hypothetical protein
MSRPTWLIRIQAGVEVIQRHRTLSRSADERTLQTAIEKVVVDEGYEVDPGNLVHGQAQQT